MGHLESLGKYIAKKIGCIPECGAAWSYSDVGNGGKIEWSERTARDGMGLGFRIVANIEDQTLFGSLDVHTATSRAGERHGLTIDCIGHHQLYRRGQIESIHPDDMANEIEAFAIEFVRDARAAFAGIAGGAE